jgi:hypothetical protein
MFKLSYVPTALLCVLFSLFFSPSSYAQKGWLEVELGLKLEDTKKAYIGHGFADLPTEDQISPKDAVSMKADDGGVETRIHLFFTPKSRKVTKCLVVFPSSSSFDSLYSEFNSIVTRLSKKYGNPIQQKKAFASPYTEETVTENLKGLADNRIILNFKWAMRGGEIVFTFKGKKLEENLYAGNLLLEYSSISALNILEKENQEIFNKKF